MLSWHQPYRSISSLLFIFTNKQLEREELERERKKKKKFTLDGDEDKEEPLPELQPPSALNVCDNVMENMTVFKVRQLLISFL